jgi:hypothetical protein
MGAEIKKPGSGRSNGKGTGRSNGKASSSRKPAGPSWEIKMESTMKRLMQDLKREIMEELPEICAKVNWPIYFSTTKFTLYLIIIDMTKFIFLLQDVVKLLNKSGVKYKSYKEPIYMSDQYDYYEGCEVPERKEFVYDKNSDTRSVSVRNEDGDKVSFTTNN